MKCHVALRGKYGCRWRECSGYSTEMEMLLRYVKELHVRVIGAARTEIAVVNAKKKKNCLFDVRI
jgi:hypothetical protein